MDRAGEDVARFHLVARLRNSGLVEPNLPLRHYGGRKGAGFHHAGETQPFVDTLPGTGHVLLANRAFSAPRTAKGESGSIGFSGLRSGRGGLSGLPSR